MSSFVDSPLFRLAMEREMHGDPTEDRLRRATADSVRAFTEPAHDLTEEFCHCLYGVEEPIHISSPKLNLPSSEPPHYLSESMRERWLENQMLRAQLNPPSGRYFTAHTTRLEPELQRSKVPDYHAALCAASGFHPGFIKEIDQGLVVTAGVRRHLNLSEDQISRGIYLHQFESEGQHRLSPYANFYAECISPHVRESGSQTPIEWAVERLKIVYGYQTALLDSRDILVEYSEHPYRRMAPHCMNQASSKLLEPRTYVLTDERRTLLQALRESVGETIVPEGIIFILENDVAIRASEGIPADLSRFLRNLPLALENGLVIDRVTELVRNQIQAGVEPSQALGHATRLTQLIYCSDKPRPWWFKEDFSLCTPEAIFTSCSNQEREQIAAKAGFAYQYVRDAHGALKSTFERSGLNLEQALHLSLEITQRFGIGNVRRAINVGEFTAGAIAEVPPEQKEALMNSALKSLEFVRPKSEIVGILAGPDATFFKPGLYSLLKSVGAARAEREGAHDNSLKVEDLDAIAQGLSRPMAQRVLLQPALADGLRSDNLLLNGAQPVKLLSAPKNRDSTLAIVTNPVSGWFNFDRQLHAECQYEFDETANTYFTFYAAKFPDPFRPPCGFLRFIQDFRHVPDPNYRHTFLEAPWERDELGRQNAQHKVNRYSIIANLLDSHIAGVLSWEAVTSVLTWVTASELPPEISKEIEVDEDWEHYWGIQDHVGAMTELVHDAHESYRKRKIADALKSSLGDDYDLELDYEDSDDFIDSGLYLDSSSLDFKRELLLQNEESLKEALARQHGNFDEDLHSHRKQELISGVQQRRFEKLQSGFRVVLSLNALDSSKKIERMDLKAAYSRFIGGLLYEGNAAIDRVECDRINEHDPMRGPSPAFRPVNFTEFRDGGYINAKVAKEALANCNSLEDFTALAARLERLHDTIIASQKLVHGHKVRWGPLVGADSKTAAARMWLEIGRLFVDEPMVDKERAFSLLAARLPEDRATRVLIRLRDLQVSGLGIEAKRGNLTVRSGAGDAHMASVNSQILSVWGYISVANVFDTVEQPHVTNQISSQASSTDRFLSLRDPLAPVRSWLRRGSEAKVAEAAYAALLEQVPKVIDRILTHRHASFGLLPLGGKIHVIHPIDSDKFEFLRDALGIDHTSFKLLHAGTSLLLPPMASSGELELVVKMLDYERVVDSDCPEIQITSPGRLGAYDCAVLGSALLLGTSTGVEYQPNAFYTSHTDTGCRMVAYDDNGVRSEFPFTTKIGGRTDILGRRGVLDAERSDPLDSDFYKIQLLHTVLIRAEEGGPMGELAAPFKAQFLDIVRRHGLEGVLEENWVAAPKDKVDLSAGKYDTLSHENAGKRHFEYAIKPCTDAWFRCQERFESTGEISGVVCEVRELFGWLESEVRKVQAIMLTDPAYLKQREALLSKEAFRKL